MVTKGVIARTVSELSHDRYFDRPKAVARPARLVRKAAIALSYWVIISDPIGLSRRDMLAFLWQGVN